MGVLYFIVPKFAHSFHRGSGKEENMRIEQTKAGHIATSIEKMQQIRNSSTKRIITEKSIEDPKNSARGIDLRAKELLEDLRLEQNELH